MSFYGHSKGHAISHDTKTGFAIAAGVIGMALEIQRWHDRELDRTAPPVSGDEMMRRILARRDE